MTNVNTTTPSRTLRYLLMLLMATAAVFAVSASGPFADSAKAGRASTFGTGAKPINGYGQTDSVQWGIITNAKYGGNNIRVICGDAGGPDYALNNVNLTKLPTSQYPTHTRNVDGGADVMNGRIGYLLDKYMDTSDVDTAVALNLLVYAMSGDGNMLTGDVYAKHTTVHRLDGTYRGSSSSGYHVSNWDFYAPRWGSQAGRVKAKATSMMNESYRKEGPYNLAMSVGSYDSSRDEFPVYITVKSALTGNGVPDHRVAFWYRGDTTRIHYTDGNGKIKLWVPPHQMGAEMKFSATITSVGRAQWYSYYPNGTASASYADYQRFAGKPLTDSKTVTQFEDVPAGDIPYRVSKSTTNPAYQNDMLPGTKFELHQNGNYVPGTRMTVGAPGYTNVVNVEPGIYDLVETYVPGGHKEGPGRVVATHNVHSGWTRYYTAYTNTARNSGYIQVDKTDSAGTPLYGAKFEIWSDTNNNGVYDLNMGNARTTGNSGVVSWSGLLAGKYKVVETAPPTGYTMPAPNARSQVVNLNWGGSTKPGSGNMDARLTFTNAKPEILTWAYHDGQQVNGDLPYGTDTLDERFDLSPIAGDTTGTAETWIFGPQDEPGTYSCTADFDAYSTTTTTTGGGQFFTGQIDTGVEGLVPGDYTFFTRWTGSSNETANDDCQRAEQAFTIAEPAPDGYVMVNGEPANEAIVGDDISDAGEVSDVADDVVGEFDYVVHGPFDSVDDISCASPLAEVSGHNGTDRSDVVDLTSLGLEPGVYNIQVKWSHDAFSVLQECADPDQILTIHEPATVEGFVWEDQNSNGLQDAGEPGLAGVEVTLDGEMPSQTTTTDANGNYSFDAMIPGFDTYVQVDPTHNSLVLTEPKVGSDDTVDSDITDRLNGTSDTFNLTNTKQVDVGYMPDNYSVTGLAYYDGDADGAYTQDPTAYDPNHPDQPSGAAVDVSLVNSDGTTTLLASVESDETSGVFTYQGGLIPGEEYMVSVDPDGYESSWLVTESGVGGGGDLEGHLEATPANADSNGVLDYGNFGVVAPPSIEVEKTVASIDDVNDNGTNDPGDTLTYQIKVTNTGGVDVDGLAIDDPMLEAAGVDPTKHTSFELATSARPSQLNLDGTRTTHVSTPDSASMPTGDLDVKWFGESDDWESLQALASQWHAVDGRGWIFAVTQTGAPFLRWTSDGITSQNAWTGAASPEGHVGLRVTRESATGNVTFWTADDSKDPQGTTWSVMANKTSAAGPMHDSSAQLSVGSLNHGTSWLFDGEVDYVSVNDVATADFRSQPAGTVSWTDPHGNVWTTNGSASIETSPASPDAGTLKRGESATFLSGEYTVTDSDADAGEIINTASATGTTPIGDPEDSDTTTTPAAHTYNVSGVVYSDENGNGKRDANENFLIDSTPRLVLSSVELDSDENLPTGFTFDGLPNGNYTVEVDLNEAYYTVTEGTRVFGSETVTRNFTVADGDVANVNIGVTINNDVFLTAKVSKDKVNWRDTIQVDEGDTIWHRVVLRNAASSPMNGGIVENWLPAGVAPIQTEFGMFDFVAWDHVGPYMKWHIGNSVAPGDYRMLTVRSVVQDAGDVWVGDAMTSGLSLHAVSEIGGDPEPFDANACSVDTLDRYCDYTKIEVPGINLEKSHTSIEGSEAGDKVVYELEVTNTGTVELYLHNVYDQPSVGSIGLNWPSGYGPGMMLQPHDSFVITTNPWSITAGEVSDGEVFNVAGVLSDSIGDGSRVTSFDTHTIDLDEVD